MKPWGIFNEAENIVVYNLKHQLVYISKELLKERALKPGMIGMGIDEIYSECSEIIKIIDNMKNASLESREYSFMDIRGLKHEVKSDFHAFSYNKNKYIIEKISKGEKESILNLKSIIKRDAGSSREMYDFHSIIASSEIMISLKKRVYEASQSPSNVLIYGETGTGKELFVQAIHKNSKRASHSFVAQNCAAVPSGLFEGIFFGTEKGGYTGAENTKGLFEMADKGTLYLDELNSMPIELQAKILRTIQEGKIRRVGGIKEIPVNVRVIASINESFEIVLREKKIRSDLFFRLNVISIEIPSLKERKEDIPKLIQYYINYYNEKFQSHISGMEDGCMEKMIRYSWPGNVRELRNMIEGIFNKREEGYISIDDIRDKKEIMSLTGDMSLTQRVDSYEEGIIKEALVINKWNISKTAKYLSIPRQTLQSKIKKGKIE